jgi:hypothetical protein
MLLTLLTAVAFCIAGPTLGICVWLLLVAMAHIFGDPEKRSVAYVAQGVGGMAGLLLTLAGIIKGLFIFVGALK